MTRNLTMAAALVAALVLLNLSGCTLVGSTWEGLSAPEEASELSAPEAASQLVASLNELDGVTASWDGRDSLSGEYYPYWFTIAAAEASDDDLVTAITDTWHELMGPQFADSRLYLEVDAGETGALEVDKYFEDWAPIDEVQLAAELDHWLAVRDVVGVAVNMQLPGYPSPDGGYSRFLSVDQPASMVDIAALSELPDLESGPTQQWWRFTGLSTAEGLPSPDAVVLTTQIREAAAGGIGSTSISSGMLPSGVPYLFVYLTLSGADANDLSHDFAWPSVLAIVDVLLNAEDPSLVSTLRIQPSGSSSDGMAGVTFGECFVEPFASEKDIALFELLGGATLPEGSAPGECPVG